MATEPITIFSRSPDPEGVAGLLRSLNAKVQIEGPDENWSKATITTGSLWRKRQLIFTHDTAYYSQPNWSVQLNGMCGYFSRFPEGQCRERVLNLIPTLRFALGTIHDPDFRDGDERLEVISQVARLLDAVLFLPSSLRDAGGRVLLGANGESDPYAIWPQGRT
jgi:hypothetical protein